MIFAWPLIVFEAGEVIAAPLVVRGQVPLVFYGDNLPAGDPIGGVENFESLLLRAKLAMENNLLAMQVE